MQHRLIWFRDDLRLDDNAAVAAALHDSDMSRISAVFLTADTEWSEFGYGANRLFYTDAVLRSLATRLAQEGVHFQVVRLANYLDQAQWIKSFCESEAVTDLYFNIEYQINERRRDLTLESQLTSTKVHQFLDRIVLQPGEVLTGEGKYYGVYSPFKRRWLETLKHTSYGPYALPQHRHNAVPVASWTSFVEAPESDVSGFATTEQDAQQRLNDWIANGLLHYDAERNRPALPGTSRLSPYLARGLLSPRQCLSAAEHALARPIWDFPDEAFSWVNELIWREFYHHLLIGYPRLSKDRAFKPETDAMPWRNQPEEIEAWSTGRTGIPIVDAGMRELRATGWMHNRVRMVVAQFLTKNLLVDWRIGERFFMRYLLDSDLAANNGGWQWSASTGTDAAPYFRVFNPVSQSESHDTEAHYITQWIPELASLPVKKRHAPWLTQVPTGYVAPIVDLKQSRQRAIDTFKDTVK